MFRLQNRASEHVAVRTYPDRIPLLANWRLPPQQVHQHVSCLTGVDGSRLTRYVGPEDQAEVLRVHPSRAATPRGRA